MLKNYFPILLFIFVGIGFSLAPIIFAKLVAPSKPNEKKNAPYECGFDSLNSTRNQFDVRYYLVGILFIIFELEVLFLFPWALNVNFIGWAGFIAVLVFLGLLAIGFIYEWKKGALEWE